ncbi:MAG TPA: hypothetical protein VI756_29930 [Blastocatellia bacterium]
MRAKISRGPRATVVVGTIAAVVWVCLPQGIGFAGARGSKASVDCHPEASNAPGGRVLSGGDREANSSDDWQVKKDQSGMGAVVEGQAQTPDGPARATLVFHCTPGKRGTTSVQFIVDGAAKMKGFPFDAFEGPDAPAAKFALITFTVHRPAGDLRVKSSCSASYGGMGVPDDSFTFEIDAVLKGRKRAVTQLSDALIAGATSFSINIAAYKGQGSIDATFSTGGASAAVSQAMKDCHSQ